MLIDGDIYLLIRYNDITKSTLVINAFSTPEKARDAREVAIKNEREKYGSLGSYGEGSLVSVSYYVEKCLLVC